MGNEQNKALLRRWLDEGWCQGNVDVADELIATDFVVHGAGGQAIPSGRQGVKDLVREWRRGFPDGQMRVLDELCEGDLVGVRLLWTGTHLGPFYGVAPSGRRVTCVSLGLDRIQDGRISEGWGELDMLGLMQRIGGVPGPASSAPPAPGLAAPTRPGPAPSSVAENKAVVRRVLQATGDWDLEAIREACDTDRYVEHAPGRSSLPLEEALRADSQCRASLPDLRFTLDAERMVAEGDRVLVRGTFSGTHTGAPLFGAPASGRRLLWGGIDIFRVSEGRLTERWRCSDTLSLMQQATAAVPKP
ncbi:ester cyclase [Corallococcus macrosporus]|uniref:Ester cyclase n=1 Tax=Corallococcus macrosporus TaxID=35 RepID=A0ABS3DJQ5_9BACT|nr:ester cyclase [Corallococcus macrosporus]MBN8231538.1 ester cyclase [Corallococcus macrosporus]